MASQPKETADSSLERLSPSQEAYLKASKEIVVKFIESGRLSPSGFQETFALVYRAMRETVEGGR